MAIKFQLSVVQTTGCGWVAADTTDGIEINPQTVSICYYLLNKINRKQTPKLVC